MAQAKGKENGEETKEPSRRSLEDGLIYSDDAESDSGSLSDAYFFQPPNRSTDDLVALMYSPENEINEQRKRIVYGEHDPLQNNGLNGIPMGPSYGATQIPYRPGGTIPANIDASDPNSEANRFPWRHHGRNVSAPESRRLSALRQKQINRERAVEEIRGTPQDTRKCRDAFFAALFLVQLVLVFFAAARFGSNVVLFDSGTWVPFQETLSHQHAKLFATIETANDDQLIHHVYGSSKKQLSSDSAHTMFTIDYQTVISLCAIAGLYACLLSMFTVGFMLIIAKSLIQVSLVFSIVLALIWGVIGYALEPHGLVPIMGFVALFLLVAYTLVVWDRIPFHSTNLYTALCAMRCTADITLLGIGMLLVALCWSLIWSMAFIGIVDTLDECATTDLYCQESIPHSHIFLYLALLFSFAWTNLVIKNIVRVTVASAIGTWWFRPKEVAPCCTSAVSKPLCQAITTSLGSICLGSLVVLPSQIVRGCTWLCCLASFRNKDNRQSTQEDNASCFGILRRYFLRCNRWSFCYIGMYGYSFAEAGDKAIQLFETREWMSVVQDNLIHNVLLLASIVIGGSTGTFGVLVEEVDGYTFTSFHKPIITAFMVGSILGFVLSNILLLGVVGSAVNTILVCFAAGPFEFHQNHPRLSGEMREVWSQQVFEQTV